MSDRRLEEEIERRPSGPSKREMEEDLRRAVLNTGGKLAKGVAAPSRNLVQKNPAPHAAPPSAAAGTNKTISVPVERVRTHKRLAEAGGDYRAIDASKLSPVKFETHPGEHPVLQWLPLASLMVDDRYQRNVLERGLANVYRIAREFDWRKFAPVIVAEVAGRYAIVDGQHRCYAAALRDIRNVPCMVIRATLAEQASAFAAINGRITRLSELQLHAAAVTAGETDAVALAAVCRAARVEVCRYPVPENKMVPRQTLAIGTLRQCLKMHGDVVLRTALTCLVSAHPEATGVLRAPLIRAMNEVCAGIPPARHARLIKAAADFDFISELAASKVRAAQSQRVLWQELQDALIMEFDPPKAEA